jgi:VWFA-related protein
MRRHLICLAVIACSATLIALTPPQERGANRLLIDAVAVDAHGMPVMDLKPAEVEVWIAGYRVPIETLTPITSATDERSNRLIVLVLDDVTLAPSMMLRVKEVARRFVNRMSPGDRMAIVTLSGTAETETTDEPGRLFHSIDAYRLQPNVGRTDLLVGQLFKTIESVARQLSEASERRKTIVGIGSAWLFDRPVMPQSITGNTREDWTRTMRAMSYAHAAFYIIEPSGVGMASAVGTGAGGFAEAAGGHAFVNTNAFTEAADRIMREAGSYYLIEVVDPPIQRKADLRELDVRVLRRGVTIRARHTIPGTPGA